MDNAALETLFTEIASNSTAINHRPEAPKFCRFNLDEAFSKLRADLDLTTHVLLLEDVTGEIDDNQADQPFDNQAIAYLVMKQVEENDFPGERDALNEARRIGKAILAMLLRKMPELRLDQAQLKYDKVGPLFGNAYGYRFSFIHAEPLNLAIQAGDWLTLDVPAAPHPIARYTAAQILANTSDKAGLVAALSAPVILIDQNTTPPTRQELAPGTTYLIGKPAPKYPVVTRVRMLPRANWVGRLEGASLQGSMDGINYDQLYVVPEGIPETWLDVQLNNTKQYAYLQLAFRYNSFGNISELELYAGSAGNLRITGQPFGNPPGPNDQNDYNKAFDSNTGTYYETGEPYPYVGLKLDPYE